MPLNSGDASKLIQEVAADLKALHETYQIVGDDQHVSAALTIAVVKMQVAADQYVQANQQGASIAIQAAQPAPQPVVQPAVKSARQPPGSGPEGRGYNRALLKSRAVTANSGVPTGGVSLPIPPLNTPPQSTPVQRVSAVGHVPTAPGLPDAVVPQGAQLHPRTLARIRAAQGLPPEDAPPTTAQPAAQASQPTPPPDDLPDLPLLDPPAPYPGAPPPTAQQILEQPPTR